MAATANLNAKLTMDDTVFSRAIRSAQTKVSGFVMGIGRSMLKVVGYAGAASTAIAAIAAIKSGIRGGIIGAAEMEREQTALNVLLGSVDKSKKLLGEVVKFADETPYEFPEVAEATRMLIAYGYSSETVIKELRKMGDVASGAGVPLKDMAYLLGTTRTQGRLYGRDLIQFTTRGIPMTQALAEAMKVNVDQVDDLVTAGKVGFPEVARALDMMTKKGGKFYDMLRLQSHSAIGIWSTLMDRLHSTERAFASPLLEKLKPQLESLINILAGVQGRAGKVGESFAKGIEQGVNFLAGAFQNPGEVVAPLSYALQAGFLESINVLWWGMRAAAEMFVSPGLWNTLAGIGTILQGALIRAFLTAAAYFEAALEAASDKILDKLPAALGGRREEIQGREEKRASYARAIIQDQQAIKEAKAGKGVHAEKSPEMRAMFINARTDSMKENIAEYNKIVKAMSPEGNFADRVERAKDTFSGMFAFADAKAKEGRDGLAKGVEQFASNAAEIFKNTPLDDIAGANEAWKKAAAASRVIVQKGAEVLERARNGGEMAPKDPWAKFRNFSTFQEPRLQGATMVGNAFAKGGIFDKTFIGPRAPLGSALSNNGGLTRGSYNRVRRGDRAARKQEEALRKMDKIGTDQTNDLLGTQNTILRTGLGLNGGAN